MGDLDMLVLDMLDLDTPGLDTTDLDTPDWDTMASVRLRPSLKLRLMLRLIPTTDMDTLDLVMLVLDTLVLDTPGWDTLVLDTPGLDTLAWDIMAVDTTWVRRKITRYSNQVLRVIEGLDIPSREKTFTINIKK